MSIKIYKFVTGYSNDSRNIYTCPERKAAKIIFVNSTNKVSSFSNQNLNCVNRVWNGGRLSIGGADILFSSTTTSKGYYMAVNPFISGFEAISGNVVCALSANGNVKSRYLSESELVLSEGESITIHGYTKLFIKVIEEDL